MPAYERRYTALLTHIVPAAPQIAGLFCLALMTSLVLLTSLVGGCSECTRTARTAEEATRQLGHFMRSGSGRAQALIGELRTMGVRAEDIDQLKNDCTECLPIREEIGPFSVMWKAYRVFRIDRGSLTIILEIGSCSYVNFEHSIIDPQKIEL